MKTLAVTLVMVMTFSLTSFTQNNKVNLKKNDIENLITGIRSDNAGLRKSAVYMAGKYSIEETTSVLIEKLRTEDDSAMKILIALALYRIGNEECVEAVQNLSLNDSCREVKRISTAILNQWEEDNEIIVTR
jgi:HEAT repeat protein